MTSLDTSDVDTVRTWDGQTFPVFIIKIKIFLTKKQKKIVILKKNGIKNKAKIALTSKLLGISVPRP